MRLTTIGGVKRVPRKRRLAGALACFGAGDDLLWRLVWWGLNFLEMPGKVKRGLHEPNPPAAVPVQPRHEHL